MIGFFLACSSHYRVRRLRTQVSKLLYFIAENIYTYTYLHSSRAYMAHACLSKFQISVRIISINNMKLHSVIYYNEKLTSVYEYIFKKKPQTKKESNHLDVVKHDNIQTPKI